MAITIDFGRVLGASAAVGGAAYRTSAQDESAPTTQERDALYRVAAIMACANGRASVDEVRGLVALRAHFEGASRDHEQQTAAIVGELRGLLPSDRRDALDRLAGVLRRPYARALAYKAAMAIAVADLETNPDENEVADDIASALELRPYTAELLAEVYAGLEPR